jgi:hypothetical protein
MSAGIPNRSSRYADEGTAAHQLAERCLSADLYPHYAVWSDGRQERAPPPPAASAARHIGSVETVRGTDWLVTEEMAEAVQVFLDAVRGAMVEGDTLLVEQRFNLSAIHPGMFGTNDACVLSPSRKTLFVFDYKHGKGHAVEAEGNPQLRYYGLGALLNTAKAGTVERLVLTIVQPRAQHRLGPIRSETIGMFDLMEWTAELKKAAVATEDPAAPLAAGNHCGFCPAAGACPKLRDRAMDAAMAEFAGASITVPADPGMLTTEQIARLLTHADLIDDWLAAVRGHALHLAESGTVVPGFKLVPKRATRKWRDFQDAGAIETALRKAGLGDSDIFKPLDLKSPAQIEKLLPKDRREALADLVVKESSGVNLVPDTDHRPAQTPSAVADFAHLFTT